MVISDAEKQDAGKKQRKIILSQKYSLLMLCGL
jgi:hypothetical protein